MDDDVIEISITTYDILNGMYYNLVNIFAFIGDIITMHSTLL